MTSSKRPRAVITIFFALSVTLIFALLLGVLESARTQAGRLHLAVAANASVDSLFSQYHQALWEEYRLLGLEQYAEEQLTEEMDSFMKPYLEAFDWFPMTKGKTEIQELRMLAGEDGEIFEHSVMDYMKYGIAASIMDALEAQSCMEQLVDAGATAEVSDLYSLHTKEAVRLEQSIAAIQDCLDRQAADFDDAASALHRFDGAGFRSAAEEVIRDLQKLPDRVTAYEESADLMQAGLKASRERLEEIRVSGELQESSYAAMEDDIAEYESYVEEDGIRRKEICGLVPRADSNILFLRELIEESEEVEEAVEEWEEARRRAEEEDDDDDEGEWGGDGDDDDEDDWYDDMTEEDFWRPLIHRLEEYDLLQPAGRSGVGDPEKEQKLENIKTFLEANFLKLILPEDAKLDETPLDLTLAPSGTLWSGTEESRLEIPDSLYMTEYIAGMLGYFGRGSYDRDAVKKGSGHLEVEYVLFGHGSDMENMSSAAEYLLGIRTGLNLLYLCSDAEKRSEARTLALEITGAFALTPLPYILTFFILSIWALAQAVCDVRDLAAGCKVPFLHNDSSFYLTIPGLLEVAAGKLAQRPEGETRGFKYIDYLKILLLLQCGNEQDYRCMDMMQMYLRIKQKDFLMERLVYSLETETAVQTAHVFSAPGSYEMRMQTAYSY